MKNLLILFFLLANLSVFGQDSTQNVKPLLFEVKMKDGSVLFGNIISQDAYTMDLQTENMGKVTLSKNQVENIRQIEKQEGIRGEQLYFRTSNRTRYFFAPSAYSLDKGELYYQNTYLFLNFFNYGITKNFSFGAGFEAISTLAGRPIIMLAPKVSGALSEKWHLSGGILYINSIKNDFDGLGIAYGTTTYGTEDHNLSAGLGYGFVRDSWSKQPVYTFSGMTRLSPRFGLVTENWIIPFNGSYEGLLSLGFRIFGDRFSFDFALVRPAISDWNNDFIAVPYIDILIKIK